MSSEVTITLSVNGTAIHAHRRRPPQPASVAPRRRWTSPTRSTGAARASAARARSSWTASRSRACIVLAAQVEGAEITTAAGLGEPGRSARLRCSEAFHGITPRSAGSARRACSRSRPRCSRAASPCRASEIREELHGNLCRCTGYQQIVDAIEAAQRSGTRWRRPSATKARRERRRDPHARRPRSSASSTSRSLATTRPRRSPAPRATRADLAFTGMLHARLVRAHAAERAPHPTGRRPRPRAARRRRRAVRGGRAQQRDPGGRAGADRRGGRAEGEHAGPRHRRRAVPRRADRAGDRGDPRTRSRPAASSSRSSTRISRSCSTPSEALADGAPRGPRGRQPPRRVADRSRRRRRRRSRGAAATVEGEYRTQFVDHAYLEPEAGVGWFDDDGVLTLRVATQVVEHYRDVARILGVPDSKVRVIAPYVGGGFGGKEDMTVEPYLALAVRHTRAGRCGCSGPATSRCSRGRSGTASDVATARPRSPTARSSRRTSRSRPTPARTRTSRRSCCCTRPCTRAVPTAWTTVRHPSPTAYTNNPPTVGVPRLRRHADGASATSRRWTSSLASSGSIRPRSASGTRSCRGDRLPVGQEHR